MVDQELDTCHWSVVKEVPAAVADLSAFLSLFGQTISKTGHAYFWMFRQPADMQQKIQLYQTSYPEISCVIYDAFATGQNFSRELSCTNEQ